MIKNKMSKINSVIKNPYKLFNLFNKYGLLKHLSDELFLKLFYRARTGYELNLNNPLSFNAKLQWLKLYNRKDIYTEFVDKYAVRKHVKEIIGEQYLIPLLGKYEKFSEINFNDLPNKFVLKSTHDSGGLVICNNKNELDYKYTEKKVKKSLKRNYYYYGREWVYKNIEPQIICEELLFDKELNKNGLVDFKFYCFNGIPYYCQVIQGRGGHETIDFYDMDWNHMPFNGTRPLPMAEEKMNKPEKFEEMTEISRKLSRDIPFIRVDLYYVNNKIYFGELTFYPSSGVGEFNPPKWNKKIGDLIELPK